MQFAEKTVPWCILVCECTRIRALVTSDPVPSEISVIAAKPAASNSASSPIVSLRDTILPYVRLFDSVRAARPVRVTTMSTPPALPEAVQRSEVAWQNDLLEMSQQAKERFPDILWERDEDDEDVEGTGEVWGHKGASGMSCDQKLDFYSLVSHHICSCSSIVASKVLFISSCTRRLYQPIAIPVSAPRSVTFSIHQ